MLYIINSYFKYINKYINKYLKYINKYINKYLKYEFT